MATRQEMRARKRKVFKEALLAKKAELPGLKHQIRKESNLPTQAAKRLAEATMRRNVRRALQNLGQH